MLITKHSRHCTSTNKNTNTDHRTASSYIAAGAQSSYWDKALLRQRITAVGNVRTSNKRRWTQNQISWTILHRITLHHNNTATNNTQCQPSTTIRRSIRRYISASDRPTWMERGAVERKGLQQPAKGTERGLRGRKAELKCACSCRCLPGLGSRPL